MLEEWFPVRWRMKYKITIKIKTPSHTLAIKEASLRHVSPGLSQTPAVTVPEDSEKIKAPTYSLPYSSANDS